MADAETNTPSLAEHYLLKEIRNKPEMAAKSVEESVVEPSAGATTEETADKAEEIPSVNSDVAPAAEEDEKADVSTIKESNEPSLANENNNEAHQAPLGESSDSAGSDENAVNEEAEETPEIKLETAPADFRFPTTNQTRHCFTRYIEHHRCVAAKGEGAPECEKFANYYCSLCPGEWIERWNEQRENGTFPGPL